MAKADAAVKAGNIVRPMFGRPPMEDVPEQPLEAAAPANERQPYVGPSKPPVDLTGKPVVMLLLGDGNSGKTLYARWALWRMLAAGREAGIAAVDPGARTLAAWFPDYIEQPLAHDTAAVASWLATVFDGLRQDPSAAVIDFGGGGHRSLEVILSLMPDFVRGCEDAGIGLVATYLLTPRVTELNILAGLRGVGLRPSAQMLVLNEATIKTAGQPPAEAFRETINHSAFQGALADGAFPIAMPAIGWGAAPEMEAKRLDFGQARDGKVPPGAKFAPIGGLKRSAVGRWLQQMEAVHQPVMSWLP